MGRGGGKCPYVPRAWEELRLPNLGGCWGGGTLEEQSLLCPLVSHGLTPNQTSARASSASNQSWCAFQTPPSFLRLLPQSCSPQAPRVQAPRLLLPENSRVGDPRFLPQTQESRPSTSSEEIRSSGTQGPSPLELEKSQLLVGVGRPLVEGREDLACDLFTS